MKLAGLQSGYAGKMLGGAKTRKHLGSLTLPLVLEAALGARANHTRKSARPRAS